MPGSHWMIVTTPENFEVTRQRGFNLLGLKSRHRKKAERMSSGDRILYYVGGVQVFPGTAIVTSTFFEDNRPFWHSTERRPELFPWRVNTRPDIVLHEYEYLDARQIAPRLMYVKRWAPEDWPLAFQGQIHLLSSSDFALVEAEMRREIARRGHRRERPPRRPNRGLATTVLGLLGSSPARLVSLDSPPAASPSAPPAPVAIPPPVGPSVPTVDVASTSPRS